ncbi:MAG: hypothetical protein ACRDRJ_25295 [Streptosporangiaceae bacterium]
MTQYGTWVSYSGIARIELAIVLLVAAGGLAYSGLRLARPLEAARPGRTATAFMLLAWVLTMATFLVCLGVYALQYRHEYPGNLSAPTDHIMPVTLIAAGITFFIIGVNSPHGPWTRLASAAIGAMAAPMIFELPFDLIVMARTYPPMLPHPALYRALFFLPLFLIEITTLSLLTTSPMVKLSRGALLCLASMLAVFAVWGLFGFAYPSAPIPTALNVLSKILAFVTVLCLFLPQRAKTSRQDPRPAQPIMQASSVSGGSHGSR